jgi:hypothetical protein
VEATRSRREPHKAGKNFYFYREKQVYEEICDPNSFYKTGLIRECCQLFINMFKVMSTGNVRLFLNTLPHMLACIFTGPCHRVSSADHIRPMVYQTTLLIF